MAHQVRTTDTLAAFNLPDGRGFRIDEHRENGVVTSIVGVYLNGPVASDVTEDDGDSIDLIVIYQRL